MSSLSTGSLARVATIALLALAAGAGCATTSNNAGGGQNAAIDSTPSATPAATGDPDVGPNPDSTQPPPTTTKTKPPAWPSPEDCISYNPANLTVAYNAGVYTVSDGGKVVLRASGQQGDNVGDKGLALAKRYRKHCFLGRDNTREEKNSFVFDYWRDSSGMNPTIPDQEDDCSPYNRNNLTVEDMGNGYGWRVKDHDHVLHLFDNESDARNGKLVLQKYNQICYIGNNGDDDPEVISYSI